MTSLVTQALTYVGATVKDSTQYVCYEHGGRTAEVYAIPGVFFVALHMGQVPAGFEFVRVAADEMVELPRGTAMHVREDSREVFTLLFRHLFPERRDA